MEGRVAQGGKEKGERVTEREKSLENGLKERNLLFISTQRVYIDPLFYHFTTTLILRRVIKNGVESTFLHYLYAKGKRGRTKSNVAEDELRALPLKKRHPGRTMNLTPRTPLVRGRYGKKVPGMQGQRTLTISAVTSSGRICSSSK